MKVFLSLVVGVAILAGISAFAATQEHKDAKACVTVNGGEKKDIGSKCDSSVQSCDAVKKADGTVVQ